MAKISEGTEDHCETCGELIRWIRIGPYSWSEIRWRHVTPEPEPYGEDGKTNPEYEEFRKTWHQPLAKRFCRERKNNGELCNGKTVRDAMCGRHLAIEEKRIAQQQAEAERARKAREKAEADRAIREYEDTIHNDALDRIRRLTGLIVNEGRSWSIKMACEMNAVELANLLECVVSGRFVVEEGRIQPLPDEAGPDHPNDDFTLEDEDDAWLMG